MEVYLQKRGMFFNNWRGMFCKIGTFLETIFCQLWHSWHANLGIKPNWKNNAPVLLPFLPNKQLVLGIKYNVDMEDNATLGMGM